MKKYSIIIKQVSKTDDSIIDIRPVRSDYCSYVSRVISDIINKKNISKSDLKLFDMVSGKEYSTYFF